MSSSTVFFDAKGMDKKGDFGAEAKCQWKMYEQHLRSLLTLFRAFLHLLSLSHPFSHSLYLSLLLLSLFSSSFLPFFLFHPSLFFNHQPFHFLPFSLLNPSLFSSVSLLFIFFSPFSKLLSFLSSSFLFSIFSFFFSASLFSLSTLLFVSVSL